MTLHSKGRILAIFLAIMILLIPTPVKAQGNYYTTSGIYVRPEKNSDVSLGIIAKHTDVTGIYEGAWFAFEYKGQKAYIASAFVAEGNAPEPTWEEFSGITNTSLYVRPYPGASESLGIIGSEMPVHGTVSGAWINFDFEGQDAYIASSFVREASTQEIAQVTERAARDYYTGYAASDVYIRPYPGAGTSLGILKKGRMVDGYQSGAWYTFTYDGQDAYVAASLITDEKPAEDLLFGRVPASNVAYRLTVSSTAYTHTGNRTATGTWPKAYHTVAVDPRVIPLGSWMYIEGYGYARAEDTGGAIRGNIVDVFFDSYYECIQWGRKYGLTALVLKSNPY